MSVIPYADFKPDRGSRKRPARGRAERLVSRSALEDERAGQARVPQDASPGYIPEYFDQTYDIGRVQSPSRRAPAPPTWRVRRREVHAAQTSDTSFSRVVPRGASRSTSAGFVQVGGLYEDRQGDPTALRLGLFAIPAQARRDQGVRLLPPQNMKSGFGTRFGSIERSLLAASLATDGGAASTSGRFPGEWVLPPVRRRSGMAPSRRGFASFFEF